MESVRTARRGLNASEQTMAIKGLRFVLLLSLTATVVWLLGVACFGEASHASVPFPNASLCIHRAGP